MANGSEDEGFSEATTDEAGRLSRIEDRLDALAAAVARLVPGSHGEAERRTEERLDRPSTVEEQVRAGLAKEREEQARADQVRQANETVAQRLAKLEETKPEPPERRSTRVMWGSTR
jgi:hypothetical protein